MEHKERIDQLKKENEQIGDKIRNLQNKVQELNVQIQELVNLAITNNGRILELENISNKKTK